MPSDSHPRLLDMSTEATEACLRWLDAVSIVTCRSVCKKLKRLVDNSETLRYILALHMCGMHDNPGLSASVPLQERVNRLREYDASRRNLTFTTYCDIPLPKKACVTVSGGYVIAMGSGKVTVHRPASKLRGIEARTWSFEFEQPCQDAGVDSESGLLAIVSETEGHKNELHFLSLETGRPHPLAFKPKLSLNSHSLRIIGDRVFYDERVFDWKSGKACSFDTDELALLNGDHTLKFDLEEDSAHADDEVGWPCPILKVYQVPTLTDMEPPGQIEPSSVVEDDKSESDAMLEPARAILIFPCFSSFVLYHSAGIESDDALVPYSVDRDGIFYTDTSDRIVRVIIAFTGYQGDDPNPSISALFSTSQLFRYVTSSDSLPRRVPWNVWSAPALIGPSRDYPYMHGRAIRALVDSHVDYEELYSVGQRSDDGVEDDSDWELAREREGNGPKPHPIRVRDYHRRRTSRPAKASNESSIVVTAGVHKSYLKRDWIGEASPPEDYEEEEDDEDDEDDEGEEDDGEDESGKKGETRENRNEEKEDRDIWKGVRPTLPVNTSSWKYINTDRDPPPELEGKAGGRYLLLDDGLVYVEKHVDGVTAHVFTY